MHIDEWKGCYPSKWKGMIVPEAISHPAKFSNLLIRRIYEHMLQEGWLKEGDVVIDPFGGVALGALDAMRHGLIWRGVELESHFADLGNKNIAFWNKSFSRLPKWSGDAALLHGDSRHLLEILHGEGAATISSPFGDTLALDQLPADERHKLAREKGISNSENVSPIDMEKVGKRTQTGYSSVVSSPPYADGCAHTGGDNAPGKLDGGEMHLPGIAGVVSNPPYADSLEKPNGIDASKIKSAHGPNSQTVLDPRYSAILSSPPYSEARIGQESGQEHCGHGDQYGATPGQLGAMKANGFDAAVGSPPFTAAGNQPASVLQPGGRQGVRKSYESVGADPIDNYGQTVGQLGAMKAVGFEAAITSPPFRQASGGTPEPKEGGSIDEALYKRHAAGNSAADAYGKTEGQLANMEEGEFQAAISSTPYAEITVTGETNFASQANPDGKSAAELQRKDKGYGGKPAATISSPPYSSMSVGKNSQSVDLQKQYETYRASGGGQSFEAFCATQELHSQGYGETEGNLANMPAGEFEASVTSPPYLPRDDRKVPLGATVGKTLSDMDEERGYKRDESFRGSYSLDPHNLGNPTGVDQESFWLAARQIVEQVYEVLRPGGHAVWVCKDFVKDQKRAPFCDQWRQLCEVVGFITLHEHHALLVRERGINHTLEGGLMEFSVASKSFFRRLSEKKASEKNYWKTLDPDCQGEFLEQTSKELWKKWSARTPEEKAELRKDGKYKYPSPTTASVLNKAISRAFAESGEKVDDWNSTVRIDHETVFCMEKPNG